LNVQEFTEMVNAVRMAEKSIGNINYELTPSQNKGKNFARSLYVVEDIKEGELFTERNIRSIRPGFGLHPKHYSEMIGKISPKNYKKGDRLENINTQS